MTATATVTIAIAIAIVRVESVPTVDADMVVRVAPLDPRPACAENPNRKFRPEEATVEAEADPEHDLARVLETSNATVVLEDLNRGVLLPVVVWGNRHPAYEGNRAENGWTVVVVVVVTLVAEEVPDRRRRTTYEKHDRDLLVRISETRILD